MADQDVRSRLFQAFNPSKEVRPTDAEFVDLDRFRHEPAMATIAEELVLSNRQEPMVHLFSGGRGFGKTTELHRLEATLRDRHGFVVVYVDVTDLLDPQDCDFADLLLATAGSAISSLVDLDLKGFGPLERMFDYLVKDLLSGADKPFDLTLGSQNFAQFKVEFGRRRSSIKSLRSRVNAMADEVVFRLKDLLTQANRRLATEGRGPILIIVDGTDKIVPIRRTIVRDGSEREANQQELVLVDRADVLCDLGAHLLLTLPISLSYSPSVVRLEQAARTRTLVLPLSPVQGKDGEVGPGLHLSKELIANRCAIAGIPPSDLFDDEATCLKMIHLAGGHPTELMRLVRSALIRDESLPMSSDHLEKAVAAETNAVFRVIPNSFWSELRKFSEPQADVDRESNVHLESLFNLWLYEYKNGATWYQVNPVLSESPGFRNPAP